MLLEYVRL